jgi:hypothetical protein
MRQTERPYSFLTTAGVRVEVQARTPRQAHARAIKRMAELKKDTKFPKEWREGKITKHYLTFGKTGFSDYTYKEVK